MAGGAPGLGLPRVSRAMILKLAGTKLPGGRGCCRHEDSVSFLLPFLEFGPIWHRSHQEAGNQWLTMGHGSSRDPRPFPLIHTSPPALSHHKVLGQGVFLLAFAPALSLLHQSHARASRAPSHLFSIILFPPEKQPEQSKHEDLRWRQSGTPNLRCILPSRKSLTPPSLPPRAPPRLCT